MSEPCDICGREGILFDVRYHSERDAPVCGVCYDYWDEHGRWPDTTQQTLTDV